jgi:hypothetical protein
MFSLLQFAAHEGRFKMDPNVEAALIAAVVTFIGYLFTRWQTRTELQSKINELTQTQLQDILAKRIEVYPKLWRIVQTELSDFERVQKLANAQWVPTSEWAEKLLADLVEWHQHYGVFLSQSSYAAFAKLRNEVVELVRTCNREKRLPTIEEFQELDRIYYQGYEGNLPLATCLKNDLGSYKTASLNA